MKTSNPYCHPTRLIPPIAMRSLSFLPLLLMCLPLLPANAQTDDMGFGLTLEAEKALSKKLSIEAEGEYRSQDGLSATERWSIGLGSAYKLTRWLKADAGYLLLARWKGCEDRESYYLNHYWEQQHRLYTGLAGEWKIDRHFSVSLRERYQYSYRAESTIPKINKTKKGYEEGEHFDDKVKEAEREHLLRSRLQIRWKPKDKGHWSMNVGVEALQLLDASCKLDQMRYSAGTGYKIDKHNSLSLEYRYKDRTDADEAGGHLLTLGYKFSF